MTGERFERLSSRYRKLPANSSWLNHANEKFYYADDAIDEDEYNINDPSVVNVKKRDAITRLQKVTEDAESGQIVKVVGLEPDKLFEKVDKYRIRPDRLPKFSAHFDSLETLSIPHSKQSVPG